MAYAQIMTTRPQTLYGLADSPVDLAAFMLDHGDGTGQPGLVEQALQGHHESDLTRDDLLDNITLYWLTNTGVSSARLYWENKADFFDAKNITIPFAISVFPDELYQAPRSWAERAYPHNLIHYNRLDRGGHFAAWEQPQLFSEEMRASFRSLRKEPAQEQPHPRVQLLSGLPCPGTLRSNGGLDWGRAQDAVLGGGSRLRPGVRLHPGRRWLRRIADPSAVQERAAGLGKGLNLLRIEPSAGEVHCLVRGRDRLVLPE